MAKVKGTAVKSTAAFLQDRMGRDGYAKLLQSLSSEESEILSGTLLQSDWYPFSLLVHLMKSAEKSLPPNAGHSLAWELGRFSAEYGLNSVYKIFFKVADVGYILRKASSLFPAYYDTGTLTILESGDHFAKVRVTGFDEWGVVFCDRLQGWMEKTVEMTGSKRVHMAHPICAARGGPHCEFHAEWT